MEREGVAMPTNDERRAVAARLREVKKTGFGFTWCKICMGVCGPECPVGCDEDKMAVDVAKRLADLIEPEPERTCKWVWGEQWLESSPMGPRELQWANWHLDCGCWEGDEEEFQYLDDPDIYPEYGWNCCPRCGRKIAKNADS